MRDKRKLFLIFCVAMCFSIIVAAFVYYWINDRLPDKFNLSVKTPETAPTPTDNLNQDTDDSSVGSTAKVVSPDETVPKDNTPASTPGSSGVATNTAAQNVIPLQPQSMPKEPNPDMPSDNNDSPLPTQPDANSAANSQTSGLNGTPMHYVYLDGFSSREAAQEAISQLQSRKLPATPIVREHHGEVIVQFGIYSDRANAQAMAQQLRNQNVFVKVE